MVATKLNMMDRIISFFSPSTALERSIARGKMEMYQTYINNHRKYEAASKKHKMDGWTTAGSGSVNTELSGVLNILRDRSRDLLRNNQYARNGVRVMSNYSVGNVGIQPQIIDRTNQRAIEIEALWNLWANSTDIDARGRKTWAGIMRLVFKTIVESGECLIRLRRRRPSDGLSLPIQLQILEPDHLDSSRDRGFSQGNTIFHGIEFDSLERPVAYWLFPDHPGESSSIHIRSFESQRIPAEDIIHIFDEERAGQVRGIPWLVSVILNLRRFDEYEFAQLERQKLAACFAVFIRDIECPDITEGKEDLLLDKIEPGIIEMLPPGKDISFANPPSVEDYSEYSGQILHGISSGFGIPYELLTGDLGNVTFSSARMGMIPFIKNVKCWQNLMLIPQLCERVWTWFRQTEAIMKNKNIDKIQHSWTVPKVESLEPSREAEAEKKEIRSGLKTISQSIKERGRDPQEHFEEYARDIRMLEELNIILDSDASKIGGGGTAQATTDFEEE